MSRAKLQRQLQKLKRRQDQLLEELSKAPPMLRGSFSQVSTRCGKPTCWCARATTAHRHNRITWSEQGTMRTRKVPQEQVDRVKELTGNYRRFRKHRRELVGVHRELTETIAKLEAIVTAQTRKPLSYLSLTPKTVTVSTTTTRKTARKKSNGRS